MPNTIGNQNPTTPTNVPAHDDQANTAQTKGKQNKVTRGYDDKNSISTKQAATNPETLATVQTNSKPTIAQLLATSQPSLAQLRSDSEAMKPALDTGHIYLASNVIKPDAALVHTAQAYLDAFTDGSLYADGTEKTKLEAKAIIDDHMLQITGLIKHKLKLRSTDTHGFRPVNDQFTKNMLESILQSLTNKLSENISKRVQQDILSNGDARSKIYEKISKIIDEKTKLTKKLNMRSIVKGRHGKADRQVANLSVWAKKSDGHRVVARAWERRRIAENVTLPRMGRELRDLRAQLEKFPVLVINFLAGGTAEVKDKVKDKLEDAIAEFLNSRQLAPDVFFPESEKIKDEVESGSVVEGVVISTDGLSSAEFMMLLVELQKTNENSEKLEEAIAMLQAGDPVGAAESLKNSITKLDMGTEVDPNKLKEMVDFFINEDHLAPDQEYTITLLETLRSLDFLNDAAGSQIDTLDRHEAPTTIVRG